jgi:hypothetical protein
MSSSGEGQHVKAALEVTAKDRFDNEQSITVADFIRGYPDPE